MHFLADNNEIGIFFFRSPRPGGARALYSRLLPAPEHLRHRLAKPTGRSVTARPMKPHPAASRRQCTSLRIGGNPGFRAHARHDAVAPGMESSGLRPFYWGP